MLIPISVSVSPPVLPQQHVRDAAHSAESAGGRLQLKTHAPYLCGFERGDTVNWYTVVWCTQNLRRDGSSFTWHQPCNNQTAQLASRSRPQHFGG